MSENTTAAPDAAVSPLDRLVGTWTVTGGAEGTVTYRWLEGGHFLIQDVELEQDGERITGVEVIGRNDCSAPTSPHMVSQLATGDGGWLQIVNFLVAGTLFLLAAAGCGRWRLSRSGCPG